MLGGSLALAGLLSVNDDALLLVGIFSVIGPAFAIVAAVTAARGSLRSAGLLLGVSALATPTYFAYPIKAVVLAAGLWLAVVPSSTDPRRRRAQPA